MMRGVVASYGRHTLAAILHDKLCSDAKTPKTKAIKKKLSEPRTADEVFRGCLEEANVHFVKRWGMWSIVHLFGILSLMWLWGPVLLALSLALWTGPILALFAEDMSTAQRVLVAVGPFAVMALLRDSGRAVAVFSALLPLTLIVLIVNSLALVVIWIPPALWWVFRKVISFLGVGKFTKPIPPIGPTRV